MTRVTATVSDPNEDGDCAVTTYLDGERYECHLIRCDMAGQWAAQEVECLTEAVAREAEIGRARG